MTVTWLEDDTFFFFGGEIDDCSSPWLYTIWHTCWYPKRRIGEDGGRAPSSELRCQLLCVVDTSWLGCWWLKWSWLIDSSPIGTGKQPTCNMTTWWHDDMVVLCTFIDSSKSQHPNPRSAFWNCVAILKALDHFSWPKYPTTLQDPRNLWTSFSGTFPAPWPPGFVAFMVSGSQRGPGSLAVAWQHPVRES